VFRPEQGSDVSVVSWADEREFKLSRFLIAELLRWFAIGVVLVGLGCSTLEAARLYQTGTQALDAGDSGRAVTDLEQAAALLPEASEVQNHLGLAYHAAGRLGDAELAFRRAVALDCENAAAVENLRITEARSALRASSTSETDAAKSVALEAP
jgi:tetratricopeptide (TPR) repeat protein